MQKLEAELADLADQLVCCKSRALTREHLDQACWKIWGYCNANVGDMNSEKHCREIREVIERSVAEVQLRLDAELQSREQVKRRLKRERDKTANLESQLEATKEQLAKLNSKHNESVRKMQAEIQITHNLREKLDKLKGSLEASPDNRDPNPPLSEKAKKTARRLAAK